MQLQKGANAPLPEGAVRLAFSFDAVPPGTSPDLSAYLLDAAGRVRGDGDMVFYNQHESSDGGVRFDPATASFVVDASRIAPGVERVAFCLAMDGGRTADLGAVTAAVDGGPSYRHATAGQPEAAIIVTEFYRRGGAWKMRAVGQGFAGGMAPLARSFGIDVADAPAAATPPPPPPAPSGVDLRKQRIEERLVNLSKSNPELARLARTAGVSLAKKGADRRAAKVWLILDVSYSMKHHFQSGAVQELGERALAYGLNLDDDGRISVILFDDQAQLFPDVDASNLHTFAASVQRAPSIWGSTDYATAMRLLRREAAREDDFGRMPVYVIFVTDGGTARRSEAERELRAASSEGIFWKFMAIGERRDFEFLVRLDDLANRTVDNADFFAVAHPTEPTDADFFDLMAEEYAGWLEAAEKAGVLAR